MIVYAIKHKPSNKLMPMRMTRNSGRGWSHWQPGVEDGFSPLPRIFKDHRSASLALTAWLQGRFVRHTGCNDGMDGPDYYDELDCELPAVERHREDMELVTFSMLEVS